MGGPTFRTIHFGPNGFRSTCFRPTLDLSNLLSSKTSTVEMPATREKIPTDLQSSPLIGNFLFYNFCSALYLCICWGKKVTAVF